MDEIIETKKSNKIKYIVFGFVTFLIVGLGGLYIYNNYENTIKTNLGDLKDKITETTVLVENKVKLTDSNKIYFDGVVEFDSLPKVVPLKFEENGRVKIYYKSDKPITFYLYDEKHFKQWEDGIYGVAKVTTGTSDVFSEGNFLVDINQGESGNYYAVFDDRFVSEKPTQATLRVVELVKIGG